MCENSQPCRKIRTICARVVEGGGGHAAQCGEQHRASGGRGTARGPKRRSTQRSGEQHRASGGRGTARGPKRRSTQRRASGGRGTARGPKRRRRVQAAAAATPRVFTRSVTHARRSSARVHMSGCGASREQGGCLKGLATVLTWNTEGTTTRQYREGVIRWVDGPSVARPPKARPAVRRGSQKWQQGDGRGGLYRP